MATGCIKCTPDDVAKQQAITKAKEQANKYNASMAIYRGPEGYEVINALTAINERYPIIQIVQVG